jgi:hypothetical protein
MGGKQLADLVECGDEGVEGLFGVHSSWELVAPATSSVMTWT